MKDIPLTRRSSGALAVLFGAVIVLAGGLWIVKSMSDAAVARAGAETALLHALQARMKLPPPDAKPAEEAAPQAFLSGANYALAANALQQRIVGLIESSGGTLVRVGIDPPDAHVGPPGRRIAAQAVAQLTNDGLQQVLYRLESGHPYIFVENLDVQTKSEEVTGLKPVRLTMDLRAFGYYRGKSQ